MVASHRLNGNLSKNNSEVEPSKGNAHVVKHTDRPDIVPLTAFF